MIQHDLERLQVQVRLSGYDKSRNSKAADSLLAAGKALDPDDLIFLVTEATRADADRDPAAAERIWKRVLEVDPNYAEAHNHLGYLYLNQGRYDEAEAAMRKYAFVAPDLANPHDSLGEVLMSVGRYEEAEAEFARALAIQPDDFPWSQVNIGKIYLQRGQIAKGMQLLSDVRQVLRGTGWERNIALLTINALFEHGIMDQLDEHTLQFVQSFPDDRSTPFIRAMRLIHHGDIAGYRAIMDSTDAVIRKEPYYGEFGSVRRDVGMTQARFEAFAAAVVGDHAAAAENFRKVLTIGADAPPHQLVFDRYKLAEQLHADRAGRRSTAPARQGAGREPAHDGCSRAGGRDQPETGKPRRRPALPGNARAQPRGRGSRPPHPGEGPAATRSVQRRRRRSLDGPVHPGWVRASSEAGSSAKRSVTRRRQLWALS